jgi:microcystin-dependent protein
MHPGNGPGLTPRHLGEKGGADTATLTVQTMASHTHQLMAAPSPGEQASPVGNSMARGVGASVYQSDTTSNLVDMAGQSLPMVGGGQAHNNLQPYLVLNFIIALVGIYPSRS